MNQSKARLTNTCAQVYLYSNELAERGVRKMEKKNVVFTKDGAKVGVKEVRTEDYADRTQKAFVKTWNAAQEKAYVLPILCTGRIGRA